jgi:hypothetical protein
VLATSIIRAMSKPWARNRFEISEAKTSETSVNFYQTTRRHNPEDSHLYARRRENLNSHQLSAPQLGSCTVELVQIPVEQTNLVSYFTAGRWMLLQEDMCLPRNTFSWLCRTHFITVTISHHEQWRSVMRCLESRHFVLHIATVISKQHLATLYFTELNNL